MDFFASQDLARKNSRRLVIYFVISVIALIAAIYFLFLMLFGLLNDGRSGQQAAVNIFNPELFAGVALGVSTIVGSGSLYKISALRGGGESVASMLGGRRIPPNSMDPVDRRILNVVEEMALAAGTPVPPVYIMDAEPGINAFAAGYTIDDAVIGVNRGTVELLTRDELQGVVAHEFSHILNGDMRMSVRMIGVLHGIQLIALIGYLVLRSMGRSRGDKKGGVAAILGIAIGLIVIGSIGLFFARLIKASLSRQREYLADSSAVQFTRNPEGIAGALKLIGATAHGSAISSPKAEEASHMFFASMWRKSFFNMFATHPPLPERIAKLDPSFDGDFEAFGRNRREKIQRRIENEQKQEEKKREQRFMGRGGLRGIMGDKFPLDPAILIAGIGLPDETDVEYSEMIVDRIPDALAHASREVFSARCVVFATLLNTETDIRRAQLHAIGTGEAQATIDETIRLMPMVDQLEERFRLPVFEILQGTLTALSPEQYQTFRQSVDRLVYADKRVDLFEFFMRHHLIVHLDRKFGLVTPPSVKYKAISALEKEICELLAILVRIGHTDTEEAHGAFRCAIDSLGQPWHENEKMIEAGFSYKSLAASIDRMNEASAPIKKKLLTAMAVAITYDRIVTVEEAEMFRAISESLDCPVPPVVATINRTDVDAEDVVQNQPSQRPGDVS